MPCHWVGGYEHLPGMSSPEPITAAEASPPTASYRIVARITWMLKESGIGQRRCTRAGDQSTAVVEVMFLYRFLRRDEEKKLADKRRQEKRREQTQNKKRAEEKRRGSRRDGKGGERREKKCTIPRHFTVTQKFHR